MVSDIRTVCPSQALATKLMSSVSSKIYSYVVTQKRSTPLGDISDKTIDVAAIFGIFEPSNQVSEKRYPSLRQFCSTQRYTQT